MNTNPNGDSIGLTHRGQQSSYGRMRVGAVSGGVDHQGPTPRRVLSPWQDREPIHSFCCMRSQPPARVRNHYGKARAGGPYMQALNSVIAKALGGSGTIGERKK